MCEKYKLRCLILAVSLTIASIYGYGQQISQNRQPKKLVVGDTIPSGLVLDKLVNYEHQRIILDDLRGKWLLLDFWGTYCPACITEMPKIARIRKDFETEVEMLLVTNESYDRVVGFLERSPKVADLNIPIAVENQLLRQLFPHRIIPHVVWIDPDGVIRAITAGEQVTVEIIEEMIISNDVAHLAHKDDNLNWDYTKPLGGQEELEIALYRSVLKRYDPSISSAQSTHRDTLHPERYYQHIYFANQNPISMYYAAFMIFNGNFGTNINPHRIKVDIKDSLLRLQYANADHTQPFFPNDFPYLGWQSRNDFYQDNLFSYDLLLETGVADSIFLDYVFDDLNKFFPVKGRVERKKVNCLVVKTNDKDGAERAIRSMGEKPRKIITNSHYGVINYPFSEFIKGFTHFRSMPIIDETDINGPVDLVIDFEGSAKMKPNQGLVVNMFPFDEEFFISEMEKYHFTVWRETREIPILVIYD